MAYSYSLFLDDLRNPDLWYRTTFPEELLIARSAAEARVLVGTRGLPLVMSLDHDLGDGVPTAMEFLHWLIEAHLDGNLDLTGLEAVVIHSANPVGAQNLAGLWNCFAADIESPVRATMRPRA